MSNKDKALEHLEREEERTLEDMKRTITSAAGDLTMQEVRTLVRRHPELAVAASAALGLVFAPMLASAARSAGPVLARSWRSDGGRALFALVKRSLF